jgi:hypothetical protein
MGSLIHKDDQGFHYQCFIRSFNGKLFQINLRLFYNLQIRTKKSIRLNFARISDSSIGKALEIRLYRKIHNRLLCMHSKRH